MDLLQALLLGAIQGATEFLPVSSSGHLVLVPWLLNWESSSVNNLAFDAMVHLGTLVAVCVYFWVDVRQIIQAVLQGLRKREPTTHWAARLGWIIVVGSIPAGLAGLLLEDWFERVFGSPIAAAVLLFVTAGLLLLAERIGSASLDLKTMGFVDGLIIGCAQALAILPGISRSGATIAAGLTRGLDRSDAARFSFLLGLPAVMAAGGLQLLRLLQSDGASQPVGTMVVGFFSAAVVGYAAIGTLMAIVRRYPLTMFAAYCAILGGSSLAVAFIRM